MSLPRYEQYKDSGVEWLGEVPAHWDIYTLKQIVSQPITDGPHETPNFPHEGIPFVSAEAVSSGKIDFTKIRGFISQEDHLQYSKKYRPQIGDIYMVKSGATTGVTAIVETEQEFNIWSPLAAIRCSHRAVPFFVLNFIRSRNFQEAVTLNWSFGTQQNIGMKVIENLAVALPPVAEQTAIAAFLDRETAKMDDLIAEQRNLIGLLKEKRQALISHAVTKGLDPAAPMKDSGVEWLGKVPKHWDVTRLKFVAKVQTGIAKGKDNTGKKTIAVPYLRVANVQNGYLALDDISTIAIPVEEMARYRLQQGDVLMNEGGDFDKLGRGHVWKCAIDNCIHQNHVFAVRPITICSEWLNQITSSDYAQFYFMTRAKQSTNLASISSTNIMELPVVIPLVVEQQSILHFLDHETTKIDDLVTEAETATILLQERRTALISAAVTGKIDVRNRVAVQPAPELEVA
ncbi:MAG: restriction endonuclease subunit S [Candidatus Accumulibacter sp.]|uniref:Restriction endonuclease subunit S n=1 Tax=Candidatus Accumulibacter affinis TaxID=2954384 RepID=A0A935W779_9PROT|nr:restriction endonuclease subunit S [Candidatus Accumulibacter affinis]